MQLLSQTETVKMTTSGLSKSRPQIQGAPLRPSKSKTFAAHLSKKTLCIANKDYKLTKLKAYDVLESDEDNIVLRNDANLKVKYSNKLFIDIPQDFYAKQEELLPTTHLVDIRTGNLLSLGNKLSTEKDLTNYIYAYKLLLCQKDIKVPKVLLTSIKRGARIIYDSNLYVIGDPNGKDKVILRPAYGSKALRVEKTKLINNENCYEG